MATTRLELREWEPRDVELPLDASQLDALQAADIRVTPRGGDRYELRPSSRIGIVTTGDLVVVVRPKVPMDRVMFVLAYVLGIWDWVRDDSALAGDSDVLEAMLPAFVHHTERAIRRGLRQDYRVEEEALHAVRGRIAFAEQIRRRPGIPLPVEVSYDDFTEDIEENRLLHTAIHLLGRIPIRSDRWRRELRGLRPAFAAVGVRSYQRGAVPEVRYHRLNEHYRPAVELARLIIEASSVELRHGEVTASSFLIDMNKVFEEFLRSSLRDALGLSDRQWPAGDARRQLTLDRGDRINLIPDLMWRGPHAGTPIFVGDAKYKRIEPDGFRHADVYQMLAYCIASDLPSGLLVYAAEEHEPTSHVVRHIGKTIKIAALDLSGSPEAILEDVGRLARIIRERHVHGAAPIHTLSA
jgi:5-methylcytosine-specific restriction enzyme subunit McrC